MARQTTITAVLIGGMFLISGGIITAVLIGDAREPGASLVAAAPLETSASPATISALQAQCALLSAGWRCGHETPFEAASLWWTCDRYLGSVHLFVGFDGDAALESFSFLATFPPGLAAETTARVWGAGTRTAGGLFPAAGLDLAIAVARESAIDQPHGRAGFAKTLNGWTIWTVERVDEIRYAEWAADDNLVVSIEAMAPAAGAADEDLGINAP